MRYFYQFPRFVLLAFLVMGIAVRSLAQLPAGFNEQLYVNGLNEATGLTFDPNGRMYVSEKAGRVWVVENGIRAAQPLINISEEVGGWRDFGLLGFALDPNYLSNGYIYLLYTVDRHHLMNFGTPAYNPAANEYYAATIGRITRYTVTNPTGAIDLMTVNYGSRLILLGETPQTGIPSLHESHGIGSLVFGTDGSLLVTCGDGASYNAVDQGSDGGTYYAQALTDGIITAAENIGAYRVQKDFSHNGKVLRLDPATGNGLATNPLYNAGAPRSPQSRLWARGLRNPCRATLRPNTGNHNPALGDPGDLYIGDVGWGGSEELNVCDAPGQNFGWPKFEGMTNQPGYNNATHAPAFHTLAKSDWRGGNARVNIGGVPTNAAPAYADANFTGNCSIGGTWYVGTDFPVEYQNTYFHADYGGQWIRNFTMSAANEVTAIKTFHTATGGITAIGSNPVTGKLYYVNNGANVYQISYAVNGAQPPHAVAAASVYYGSSPLGVNFQGSLSTDPDNQPLSYLWKFGDNTTSTLADPSHVFTGAGIQSFTVKLIVTDTEGLKDSTTLTISLNNTPPVINSTSVDAITSFTMSGNTVLPLSAVVTDAEGGPLTYAWETFLVHDNHEHKEAIDNNAVTSTTLSPVGCDGILYYYREELTVTDNGGLSAKTFREFMPDCDGPTALNDRLNYNFGATTALTVLSNDYASPSSINPATVTIVRQPQYGTATVNTGTGEINYLHSGSNSKDDYLLYTVNDNGGNTSGVAKVFLKRGGNRGVTVTQPIENEVLFATSVTVNYSSFGALIGDEKVRLTLDGGAPVTSFFVNGSYTFTGLGYGNHNVLVQLLDASNTPLGNPEASLTRNFTTALKPYPGTVKNSLALWLRADEGVATSGGDVSGWADQSSSGFDVAQGIVGKRPTLENNDLNYNPTLNFDGDDRLFRENVLSNDLFNTNTGTVIIAQRAAGVVSFSHGVGLAKTVIEQCGSRFDFAEVTVQGAANNCGQPHITAGRANLPNREVIMNGVQIATNNNAQAQDINNVDDLEIGAFEDNYFATGDIAEVVVYQNALSEIQLDSVLTYLAIKYGITIDVASHLYYDHAGYPNNIAGIGRDALKMDLVQPQSRSSNTGSIVIMGNPSSLEDGDYLVWGHNGASLALTSTGLPSGISNRLNRIWRVQETNETGTVDVSLDLSTAGIPIGGAGDVKLLVDNDTDFSNATVYAATAYAGGIATIPGINFSNGQYFSVAVEIACAPYCSDFNPVGNSSVGSLGCYEITPALGNQAGAVWFDSLVSLADPFRFEFDLYLGVNDANGADGVAFSLQRTGLGALGALGGGLGIGGITPAFSTEFDTWQNDANELAADHISIFSNGNQANVLAPQVQASATSINIEDGAYHRVIFDWDPVADVFEVYFDGSLRSTYNGDISLLFPNPAWAYFGFSGGTGGSVNQQSFCVIDLDGVFKSPADVCFNCTPGGFITNGTATSNGASCIRLTEALNGQTGTAWYYQRIDLRANFNIQYTLYSGANDAGADGTSFVFQRATTGTATVGTAGGGLGLGGITPSVAVEFDTYFEGATDITNDHINILSNGNFANQLTAPVCATTACSNIEDGVAHNVEVNWNATTNTLTTKYDGVTRATYTGNIVTNIFGGNPLVYFGFTGATGGLNNLQECCVQSISATLEGGSSFPVELLSFEANVREAEVELSWVTAWERDNDYFTVERSQDGQTFETLGYVPGTGNSTVPVSYQLTDAKPYSGLSYYRLLQTDLNGMTSVSDQVEVFIDPAVAGFGMQVYPNPSEGSETLTVEYTLLQAGQVILEVFDGQGRQTLHNSLDASEGDNVYQLPVSRWAQGVYYLRLSQAGKVRTTRVVID
ncbi:MAG: T9SS C-terminal target domain-containing protein [Bacteroidetes bacterium]|nr:MAG: T9SS C-terminal target domain-containing protein [Bacteroidota bacterium]